MSKDALVWLPFRKNGALTRKSPQSVVSGPGRLTSHPFRSTATDSRLVMVPLNVTVCPGASGSFLKAIAPLPQKGLAQKGIEPADAYIRSYNPTMRRFVKQ